MTRNRALLGEFTALLRAAGIERRPTEEDISAFAGWREALPEDVIALAAARAKGKSYPISYMRRLIERWLGAGVATLAAAEALGDAPAPEKKQNPALNYEQRTYKDEDFDDSYYMDTARKLMDGGDAS